MCGARPAPEKSDNEIKQEIQAIIRQVPTGVQSILPIQISTPQLHNSHPIPCKWCCSHNAFCTLDPAMVMAGTASTSSTH